MLQASLINIVTYYDIWLDSLILYDTYKKQARQILCIPNSYKI